MSVLALPPFKIDDLMGILDDICLLSPKRIQASCPICGLNSLMVDATRSATNVRCMNGVPGCHPNEILRALQKRGFSFGSSTLTWVSNLHVVSVARLIEEYRKPKASVVEGLIPDKSLLLLAGKAKVGKSLLAIDILDAIATGEPVFGTLANVGPAPVVYMGMEDGPAEIAQRILARGMDTSASSNFHIVPERFLLTEPTGIQALYKLYEELKPRLIVVDTAREALAIRDWANASELGNRLRPIREFARECCSVILVTHNRKRPGDGGDEICGSTALTSSVDGWISVTGKEELASGVLRLTLSKLGRGGIHGEHIVDMDPETLRFTMAGTQDTAPSSSSRMKSLLEAILPADGRITAPLAASTLNVGERNAQRLLQRFITLGWIAPTGEHSGVTNRTVVYMLTPSAPAVNHRPELPPRPLWDVEAEKEAVLQIENDRIHAMLEEKYPEAYSAAPSTAAELSPGEQPIALLPAPPGAQPTAQLSASTDPAPPQPSVNELKPGRQKTSSDLGAQNVGLVSHSPGPAKPPAKKSAPRKKRSPAPRPDASTIAWDRYVAALEEEEDAYFDIPEPAPGNTRIRNAAIARARVAREHAERLCEEALKDPPP